MIRDYKGVSNKALYPEFFIGLEVENTKAFECKTLFCRGNLKLWRIMEELAKHDDIEHVYLNHNHTRLDDRENKIIVLTKAGYMVTEEVNFVKQEWPEPYRTYNDMHIILVSIQVPYAETKNVFLKIDDAGFRNTNSGVWTFHVSDLDPSFKTEWDAYGNDEIVDKPQNQNFSDHQ